MGELNAGWIDGLSALSGQLVPAIAGAASDEVWFQRLLQEVPFVCTEISN